MNTYIKNVKAFQLAIADGTPFFVFDTETTSRFPSTTEVIQFSALKCRLENGEYKVIDQFDTYVNPGFHIPDDASAINHIYDDTVKDAPKREEAAKKIYAFLGDKPILVGYNSVSFDEVAMKNMYVKALGRTFDCVMNLDVLKMAKDKCEPPRKLGDIVARLGLNTDNYGFHSSLEDVKATLDVMVRLISMYNEEEESLLHTVSVVGHGRWMKGDMDRMYINTTDRKIRVFYDLKNKSWDSSDPTLDIEALKRDVYNLCGASSDADFDEAMQKAGWL